MTEHSLSNKPKLIIYGIGSMASTYASYAKAKYDIVAFAIEAKLKQSDDFAGLPLYSLEQLAEHFDTKTHSVLVAVGYVQMNQVRARIATEVKRQGFCLAQYVDPSLRRHDDVTIGENSVIFDQSSLHCQSTVGDNVFISSGVHIGHDCHIGNNVWINAGVCIGGGVTIKDNCFIGMNATLSHGLTLEANSFIGAATLVNKSTTPSQVVIAPAGEVIAMNSETFLRFSKVMNHD